MSENTSSDVQPTRWDTNPQVTKSIHFTGPFFCKTKVRLWANPVLHRHCRLRRPRKRYKLATLSFGLSRKTYSLLGPSPCGITLSAYYRSDSVLLEEIIMSLISHEHSAISVTILLAKLKKEDKRGKPWRPDLRWKVAVRTDSASGARIQRLEKARQIF